MAPLTMVFGFFPDATIFRILGFAPRLLSVANFRGSMREATWADSATAALAAGRMIDSSRGFGFFCSLRSLWHNQSFSLLLVGAQGEMI